LGTTAVADDQSGFIGCQILESNDVIGVSRNGGISRWIDGKSVRCFGGHSDAVTGLTWTPIGCFISVGLDNVARVFQPDATGHSADRQSSFRESARPLIHGHAVFDVVPLAVDLYAFAADEKNVRLLRPTQCFARNLPGSVLDSFSLPFASMVPSLTLENRIFETPEDVSAEFAPLQASDFCKDRVPDAHEMWLTRWPEVKSLWGHERELRQLTVSSGSWFASGDDRGGFVVWEKESFAKGPYVKEESKALTTAIAASPDASLLLLVLENGIVKLIDPGTSEVVHQLECPDGQYAGGWAANSEYFAVGGKNGLLIWGRDGSPAGKREGVFVTAIEFLSNYDLLVGMDGGEIERLTFDASAGVFSVVTEFQSHGGRVNDIRYNQATNQFVSGSADHAILVQSIDPL
jgi:WD40 repeat protein